MKIDDFFAELKRRNVYKVRGYGSIPMFDPLRNDPRFQKLVASDAAK